MGVLRRSSGRWARFGPKAWLSRIKLGILAFVLVGVLLPGVLAPPARAVPEDLGEIVGHIKAPGNVPVTMMVYFYRQISPTAWDYAGSSMSQWDQGGRYASPWLTPGQYRVYFATGTYYLGEYWKDRAAFDLADPVTAAPGTSTELSDAIVAEAGLISGRVRGPGGGDLDDITVTAYNLDWSHVQPSEETSVVTSNGRYEMGGLRNGQYYLEFYDVDGRYATEYYNARVSQEHADKVTVIEGQTVTVNQTLPLSGSITGAVKDPSGNPLANISVTVYVSDGAGGWDVVDSESTWYGGLYSIYRLSPGQYKVGFYDGSHVYPTQYYNNKSSLAAGDYVTVTSQKSTHVDATLRAQPTVTALSPSHGSTAAGTAVTITGTNLIGATAVTFGGVSATNVTVVSGTKVTCKAPGRAAGKVDVTVVTPSGTSSVSGTGNDYYYTARYEQSDAHLLYGGTWTTVSDASASGRSFKQTKTSGSYAAVQFTGTRLYWLATTGPGFGKASVSVDGKAAVTVDLQNATIGHKKVVWNTGALAPGSHTVQITWKATSGKYVDLDALDVAGSLTTIPSTKAYQETASGLTWSSGWTLSPTTPGASGGKYKSTNTSGAKVTFGFTGVRLSILARVAPYYGKLSVSIDGGTAIVVNLYAKTATFKTVWNSAFLKPGVHTVAIKRLYAKNGASTGYTVSLDALVVRGTVP